VPNRFAMPTSRKGRPQSWSSVAQWDPWREKPEWPGRFHHSDLGAALIVTLVDVAARRAFVTMRCPPCWRGRRGLSCRCGHASRRALSTTRTPLPTRSGTSYCRAEIRSRPGNFLFAAVGLHGLSPSYEGKRVQKNVREPWFGDASAMLRFHAGDQMHIPQ